MKNALLLCASLVCGSANALVIDTTATWTGSINNGWNGSGQSFTVDTTENYFDDITFSFDAMSNGRTFNFMLSDALNGGNSLFSSAFVVNNGFGFIDINTYLTPGSAVYALIDYNGYTGKSAYYQSNVYAGGNSNFYSGSSSTPYGQFDHVFVANFGTGSSTSVSEPSMLALLGISLFGAGFIRKRK